MTWYLLWQRQRYLTSVANPTPNTFYMYQRISTQWKEVFACRIQQVGAKHFTTFLYRLVQLSNRGLHNTLKGKAPWILVARKLIDSNLRFPPDVHVPKERLNKKNNPSLAKKGRRGGSLKICRPHPTSFLGPRKVDHQARYLISRSSATYWPLKVHIHSGVRWGLERWLDNAYMENSTVASPWSYGFNYQP